MSDSHPPCRGSTRKGKMKWLTVLLFTGVAIVGGDQWLSSNDLRYRVSRNYGLRGIRINNARALLLNLAGQSLQGSDLRGARLERCCLRRTSLCGADLRNARFLWCDFERAELAGANLAASQFRNCNLSDALLSPCNLEATDLSGAQLYGADLRATDLAGARFTGALYDDRTQWPAKVNPKALGARYDPDDSSFEVHGRLRNGEFLWFVW